MGIVDLIIKRISVNIDVQKTLEIYYLYVNEINTSIFPKEV